MAGDALTLRDMLRDPAKTDLFYGFEVQSRSLLDHPVEYWNGHRAIITDRLHLLCGATGTRRVPNPERPAENPPRLDVDALISCLDAAFRIKVEFPNPFDGEVGLVTPRGVASERAVQALYQAWRIARLLTGISAPRVIEIGAGLGRTAYYAWQLRIRDYTIIDIPMSAVAQAYFLGRVLGHDAIRLFGEPKRPGIHILPPSVFMSTSDRYDLAINVDSLTEMANATAAEYVRQIEQRTDLFWSVNHEANAFCVRDLFSAAAVPHVSRMPYWLRPGYVDELLDLRQTSWSRRHIDDYRAGWLASVWRKKARQRLLGG
jgi:hypothetical protein